MTVQRRKLRLAALTAGIAVLTAGCGGSPGGSAATQGDAVETGKSQSADLVWQGKGYDYNDSLSNFLFIGVDNREKEKTTTGRADAGQADALYLASWDRKEDTLTVVTIPRDTLTDIEVFGPEGKSLGMTEDHISLSYAYGDGGHESCTLTEEAVSELFYGLPIQGYCSINLDGIPVLTECVGGVTVIVPNDSLSATYPELREGAEVELTEENTETFVRYRDTSVSQSALSRTERQQEYLEAFGTKVKERFAEDPGVVTELYEALEPYMVTNIGNDQFAKIMESIRGEDAVKQWTVPGEGRQGETYDEYIADDEALYEKIIETFYEETED